MFDRKRDIILFENKWMRICERDRWYTYFNNVYSQGKAVMVLVYDFSSDEKKILGRYEHTPCHEEGWRPEGVDERLNLTSITGAYDKPEKTLAEVALEELDEEAGIQATLEELESLGSVYQSKASDTKVYLYALDGSSKKLGEVRGDGSLGEEGSFVKWHEASHLLENINCSLLGMAYVRLLMKKGLL
jgi:8-oxo-dGTP pyrophosphatase MutT (NUDIX family)